MITNKRVDWVDVAKGIGMICVILAHVEEQYLKMPLYTFHMPLFFFLSGYLFSIKSSFKEFLISKCRRILVPYFCLGGILILFDIYWNGRNSFNQTWYNKEYAMYDITQLFVQKRFLTLWFIACLFWLSLLFYVLVRFIKKEVIRAAVVILLTAEVCVITILTVRHGSGIWMYVSRLCLFSMWDFYAGKRILSIRKSWVTDINRYYLWDLSESM